MKEQNHPPLGVAVDRAVMPPALDFAGNEVPRTCENCEGLYDDSDGYEYGPPCMRCRIKPHMENLRGFPFKTPQQCFQIAWWHLVDWAAEGRKLDGERHTENEAAITALRYLMERFDNETWVCAKCGHEEPTSIADSAHWLRDWLQRTNAALCGHREGETR